MSCVRASSYLEGLFDCLRCLRQPSSGYDDGVRVSCIACIKGPVKKYVFHSNINSHLPYHEQVANIFESGENWQYESGRSSPIWLQEFTSAYKMQYLCYYCAILFCLMPTILFVKQNDWWVMLLNESTVINTLFLYSTIWLFGKISSTAETCSNLLVTFYEVLEFSPPFQHQVLLATLELFLTFHLPFLRQCNLIIFNPQGKASKSKAIVGT
jgi:hypothetical protein